MSELPSFFRKTIKEKKLESHKKVCENKGFGNLMMPSEDIKILEFNHYLENSSTTKVSEHIPSGFLMSTISSLRSIENKDDVYRGKQRCIQRARNENN